MCPALFSRLRSGALVLLALPLTGLGCGGNGGTDIVLPSLTITTSTTGVELDPDGYSFSVDGQAAQPIGAQATVTVDRLGDGQHTIELSGMAPNCAVEGENPRTVTVASGATATVAFAIVCGAGTGAVRVVTATSGPGTDPDGFILLLDGADRGTTGPSATTTLSGIEPGPHTVGLAGLAGNCQAAGENPREVTVVAGQTAELSFAVTCTAPGPTTGSLEISVTTTGTNQDPNGYQVSVDGGASQPIGTNATVTLANVSAVQHTVQLLGLAANCAVTGDNPIGAAVPAGGTATVAFSVNCVATAGELAVTISGLPSGAQAAVTVSGPNNFSQILAATQTLTGLAPGRYTVSASNVVSGGTTYTPSIGRPNVDVVAGGTAEVAVSYTAVAPVTLNLRIDGLYLTQSTQTYESDVPLVADRPGYLRVFVVANESNTARPSVRVRLRNGSGTTTRTLVAPGGSTPTIVREEVLESSWNLAVEAELVRPGLSIEAEVDPGNTIEESNEGDNRFPASGTKPLTVRTVPVAAIRFVRVLQTANGLEGTIGSTSELMGLARRVYPLNEIQSEVRSEVFSTAGPLHRDGSSGWNQLLSDLEAARVAEAPDRTYFGIVKLDYGRSDGVVGLAFQAVPTAVGWDDPSDASRVVAHELGHTWGRRHSPCGNPPASTLDDLYPYPGGQIGVFGMDVTPKTLKAPSSPDIMGYCFQSPWISDYTYQNVMTFRESSAAAIRVAALPQPSMLIRGRVVNGRPVLEPTFQIVARPSLPTRPGPYSVIGTAVDGAQLFAISFEATPVADDPQDSRHFAFAVPLDPTQAARLSSVQLAGPGGLVANSRAPAQLQVKPAEESIVARREGQSVVLQWNASAHPTIMVRDPDTGQVLSFARGGIARVWTTRNELDLELSDGVQSQRLRLAIRRS